MDAQTGEREMAKYAILFMVITGLVACGPDGEPGGEELDGQTTQSLLLEEGRYAGTGRFKECTCAECVADISFYVTHEDETITLFSDQRDHHPQLTATVVDSHFQGKSQDKTILDMCSIDHYRVFDGLILSESSFELRMEYSRTEQSKSGCQRLDPSMAPCRSSIEWQLKRKDEGF